MSAHWQREIAFFDLFIASVFGWTARQPDLRIKRNVTLLLCGLSLLLGKIIWKAGLPRPRFFMCCLPWGMDWRCCGAYWPAGTYGHWYRHHGRARCRPGSRL
jgi:hypothetical protein